MKTLFVYIMTNHLRTTVYIGVTNDLARRVWQHQHCEVEGFTKDYLLTLLVYFEVFPEPRAAIAREKQLKNWRRTKKDALINTMNPEWRDLSGELFQAPADRRGPSTALRPPFRLRSAQDDTLGKVHPRPSPAPANQSPRHDNREEAAAGTRRSRQP